jgi:putative glutamine amidotransferase
MLPIIGIFAEFDDDKNSTLQYVYTNAIEKSGGLPLLLPWVESEDVISRFASVCDGFLFTGGVDVNPTFYGEEPRFPCGKMQLNRDTLEMKAIKVVLKTKKPILCICRGAQLINVVFGGSLYQDIPSDYKTDICHRQKEDKFSPSHSVLIEKDTPLYQIVKKGEMTANSFHHQAVKKLGKGFKVMAKASDGVIEGFYFEGEQYIRAYQWHPERIFNIDSDNRQVFADFIERCKERNF